MKLQIVTLFALLAVADAGISTSFPTVAVSLSWIWRMPSY